MQNIIITRINIPGTHPHTPTKPQIMHGHRITLSQAASHFPHPRLSLIMVIYLEPTKERSSASAPREGRGTILKARGCFRGKDALLDMYPKFSENPYIIPAIKKYSTPHPQTSHLRTFPANATQDFIATNVGRFFLGLKGIRRELRKIGGRTESLVRDILV